MSRKSRIHKLSAKALEHYAEHLSDISECSDFSNGSSDFWEPSSADSDVQDNVQDIENDTENAEIEEENLSSSSESITGTSTNVIWSTVPPNFVPKKKIPFQRECEIPNHFNKDMEPLDFFYKLFPRSLLMYIAQCTNERLEILRKVRKDHSIVDTDIGEIKIVLGSSLIMSYNRLPALSHYWSRHASMGDDIIKKSISRDRFKLISSKL